MEALHTCRDKAHKYYGELLLAAEKTLSRSLYDQAEKSSSNEDQQRYYEAMQQLKNHSGVMHASFHRELARYYQVFIDGHDTEDSLEDKIDVSNLSLIKRDELEDELAISVIVSRSNSRNSEQLWKLNRRLAVLRGGKQVTDESNPFGPTLVCNAMKIAVSHFSVDSKARIFIFRQLGKIFVSNFGKILDKLNNSLVSNGILPNLRFSVAKTAALRVKTQQAPATDDTLDLNDASKDTNISILHQQELYNAITNLQSLHPDSRTETAGGISFSGVSIDGTEGVDSFSPIDYALALSAVQQSRAFLAAATLNKPLNADLVESKLFAQLKQQSDPNSRHKMTNADANTVDLVGMIFRYMLDDPKLNDAVKSMLSHLHTPYLKLALMDSKFLQDYQHSARLLLNQMADLGSRWVKSDKDRKVLPKIKIIVETILNNFVDDISLFDQLLEEFSKFKMNLEKRSRMVERRNTESQQGLERLELAKRRAREEISKRLQDANTSAEIGNLLQKTWEDFLSFNLLRHGEEGLAWQSALKVVDGVVWSVRPKTASGTKEDFQRRQIELEKTVSEGLKTIGYDLEASKSLIVSLREAHELAFSQSGTPSKESNQPSTESGQREMTESEDLSGQTENAFEGGTEKELDPEPTPISEEEQKMMDRLTEVAFGTLFEFRIDGNIHQFKLAWYSQVTSHYMFVDNGGMKQIVKNQIEVAKGLTSGEIRIVKPNKRSFMERALEAVLKKLST